MNQAKKNKHGLSRYIKSSIKEKIRKDAGYGCIFCGCVLVEYEHIEPEFHNAEKHDPNKMTLLCPMCHDKVTKKIISKKKVWLAKDKPKGLINGYVSDTIFVATDSLSLDIGNTRTSMMAVAINLYGKPMFWFEPCFEDGDEEFKICCIFYGHDGKPIAYINRNEYIALVGRQDIISKGTTLKISDKKVGCLLELSREGDRPLHIKQLFTQLYSTKVVVNGAESPICFGNVNLPNEKLSSIGSLTLAGQGYSPNGVQTALGLGGIPTEKYFSAIFTAMAININSQKVIKFDGSHIAWVLGNRLVSKSYKYVGIIEGSNIYSITGEFVANLINSQIVYANDQYDSGEPIFIIPNDRRSKNARIFSGYDLSHRFIS